VLQGACSWRFVTYEITDDSFAGSIINKYIAIPYLTEQYIYLSAKDGMTYTEIILSLIHINKLITDSKIGGSTKTIVVKAHTIISSPNDKKMYCHICNRTGHSTKAC
jgi:hypothetical protein